MPSRTLRSTKRPSPAVGWLSSAEIGSFRRVVYAYVRRNRRILPWRQTGNPYHILISEIMLQQTQVGRVVEKYGAFIARFPDIRSLAAATLSDIFSVWHGLGYNRRALLLKKMAAELLRQKGKIPRDPVQLEQLPGIGPYTARAIAAFAFNQPVIVIETNIRSVFLHHFFPGKTMVHDREILPLIEQTLDRLCPRRWYAALMDYGAMLKTLFPNPSRRSAHYARQSPFAGSQRQLRGKIMKALIGRPRLRKQYLYRSVGAEPERIDRCLRDLCREGLVQANGAWVQL
ncbi:MAG: A/G-specific adenine glycosylase [Candidatus Omnitrophica bacterium]|nr:A/G-specific adenine glycosylase [Candidatus Omnitrophota bacterium]